MMNAPSLHLPACPRCSNVLHPFRPVWRLARHTSEKEGKQVFCLIGCAHVADIAPMTRFVREESEWTAVEAAWAKRAEELFAEVTKHWSGRSRDALRRCIEGRGNTLPGATEPLPLGESGSVADAMKSMKI